MGYPGNKDRQGRCELGVRAGRMKTTTPLPAERALSTEVKICGIRTVEALDAVIGARADLFGLVFFERSPRCVSIEDASRLAAHARARSPIRIVTLVVDPEDALVDAVVAAVSPDMIQLHGHEPLERVRYIRRTWGRKILKVVSVSSADEVGAAHAYHAPGVAADMLLYDAKPPPGAAHPGGNGLIFDWHILEGEAAFAPFALAGGLTSDNVGAAIELTRAALVDVSSGVESAPGVKDAARIERFVRAARAAKTAG